MKKKMLSLLLMVMIIVACLGVSVPASAATYTLSGGTTSSSRWLFDPGHGGTDPGAVLGTRYEKNDVLRLSKRVAQWLEANGESVSFTRINDATLSLNSRSNMQLAGNYQYFVSFHRNAGGGKGVETFYHSSESASSTSANLAGTIQNWINGMNVFTNRGVKTQNFHVLRETNIPAVLIEAGFIDSTLDNALFDQHFEWLSQSIAAACLAMVGKSLSNSPDTPKDVTHTTWENVMENGYYGALMLTDFSEHASREGQNATTLPGYFNDSYGGSTSTAYVRNGGLSLTLGPNAVNNDRFLFSLPATITTGQTAKAKGIGFYCKNTGGDMYIGVYGAGYHSGNTANRLVFLNNDIAALGYRSNSAREVTLTKTAHESHGYYKMVVIKGGFEGWVMFDFACLNTTLAGHSITDIGVYFTGAQQSTTGELLFDDFFIYGKQADAPSVFTRNAWQMRSLRHTSKNFGTTYVTQSGYTNPFESDTKTKIKILEDFQDTSFFTPNASYFSQPGAYSFEGASYGSWLNAKLANGGIQVTRGNTASSTHMLCNISDPVSLANAQGFGFYVKNNSSQEAQVGLYASTDTQSGFRSYFNNIDGKYLGSTELSVAQLSNLSAYRVSANIGLAKIPAGFEGYVVFEQIDMEKALVGELRSIGVILSDMNAGSGTILIDDFFMFGTSSEFTMSKADLKNHRSQSNSF